jgi:hypothetical protein
MDEQASAKEDMAKEHVATEHVAKIQGEVVVIDGALDPKTNPAFADTRVKMSKEEKIAFRRAGKVHTTLPLASCLASCLLCCANVPPNHRSGGGKRNNKSKRKAIMVVWVAVRGKKPRQAKERVCGGKTWHSNLSRSNLNFFCLRENGQTLVTPLLHLYNTFVTFL